MLVCACVTWSRSGLRFVLELVPATGVCVYVLCVFQRQQVVMTEQWAKTHSNVHFSVMHPGWVDTPGTVSIHHNYIITSSKQLWF